MLFIPCCLQRLAELSKTITVSLTFVLCKYTNEMRYRFFPPTSMTCFV